MKKRIHLGIIESLLVLVAVFAAIGLVVGVAKDLNADGCQGFLGAESSCVEQYFATPLVVFGLPLTLLLVVIIVIKRSR